MKTYSGTTPQQLVVASGIVAISIAGAILISQTSIGFASIIIIGLIVAVFTFLNTEFALYALIIAMLLGPQIGLGPLAGEGARARGFTLRVDDFLIVIIGLTWFFKSAVQKELGLFLRTPLNIPIALYFLACVISTLLGYMMDRVRGIASFFFVLKYFEYYMIYFMAVNHLREKKQIERFVLTLFSVCFIVSIIAVYSMSQGIRASAPFEGTTGEPNTLGGYLIFMISLALGLLLTWGNRAQKILLILLLFVSSVALAATQSRTSWIALGPMALTLLFLSDKKKTVIFMIVLFIIAAPFVFPQSVKDRIMFTISQPRESGQMRIGNVYIDTSTSARFESMKLVLTRDFVKQPILGFGVTGHSFLDAQYARVLAESGLVGLIAFLFLLRRIFKLSRETYDQSRDLFFKGLTLGYITGFSAMLTHCIGANTFIIVRIMEPFWFVTAMVMMIPVIENQMIAERKTASAAS